MDKLEKRLIQDADDIDAQSLSAAPTPGVDSGA